MRFLQREQGLCLTVTSYWVAVSSLYEKGGALSYSNLVCHDWVIYIGGLPSNEDKGGGVDGLKDRKKIGRID